MATSLTLPSLSLKLSRSNYNYWRPQVLSTVRAHGLDDYLLGIIPAPTKYTSTSDSTSAATQTATRQINSEYLDWVKRDQLLVSWLLSSVSEAMLGHISRCSSANEIWLVLEKLIQNTSKARILQLRAQLHAQKKGDLSIDEYMAKMREIADDLMAAGHAISDDDFILHILEGVGREFDAVVVILRSRVDKFTIPEVHFALQTHELRIQNNNSALLINTPSVKT